jgi:beta-lactamase class A
MAEIASAGERSERVRSAGRHVSEQRSPRFAATFASLGRLAYDGARVSASALDLGSGTPVLSIDDGVAMPTAGVGRVLLLIEVSARLTERDDSGYGILDKPVVPVHHSGLWQHLQVPSLPVVDLALLVGSTSDNLAMNALLERVGLDAVRSRADGLGLSRTALLDIARDKRGPDDAPALSVGSTLELSSLLGRLAREEVVDRATSQRVLAWLGLGSDLSMVAGAFGLDPLGHRTADHATLLVNATGSAAGVRAEAGALRGRRTAVSYAVSVQFDDSTLENRLEVIDAMRAVGRELLEYVH